MLSVWLLMVRTLIAYLKSSLTLKLSFNENTHSYITSYRPYCFTHNPMKDMLATRKEALEKGVLSWGCTVHYRGYEITAGNGWARYRYVHQEHDGSDDHVGYSQTLEGCIRDINELIEC